MYKLQVSLSKNCIESSSLIPINYFDHTTKDEAAT